MAEVAGHCLTDIRRQRQAVVLASLAPYLQYSGSPIDVIEFQGNDLARPQPQTGQQKDDSAIARSCGAVPVASADDPFNLLGREVLRQIGEPPLRNGRNGSRKIALRLPIQEQKSKEGTQGRYHHLGSVGTALASMSQEERSDVVKGQVAGADRCVPKVFNEETPSEATVMMDCCRDKTAFFVEVAFILTEEGREWRIVSRRLG
jgi:hypothetical protein